MKKTIFFSLLMISSIAMVNSDFYSQQLTFPRVKKAQINKGRAIETLLSSNGIDSKNFEIFLRAFKKEQKLELFAKNKSDNSFKLLKTYDFCATTGVLGPKRRSGDRQIPEGFYTVNFFNPQSQYHLSFRINYPNESDLVFADKLNPGDNIFIHGSCITIGCIPIGDDMIEELYLFAVRAKSNGQNIPVHIFPMRMNNMSELKGENAEFWSWLKPGYDAFENTKVLPKVRVASDGKYIIQ
ncbi:MAG: L,D-transpeptidase family protein [Spirosomaceae bacterium]|jgi:murein L,D-transpeptidase YafK|nr:L,D-transpeptidase family protein [Spirosomataceae bacterium]